MTGTYIWLVALSLVVLYQQVLIVHVVKKTSKAFDKVATLLEKQWPTKPS